MIQIVIDSIQPSNYCIFGCHDHWLNKSPLCKYTQKIKNKQKKADFYCPAFFGYFSVFSTGFPQKVFHTAELLLYLSFRFTFRGRFRDLGVRTPLKVSPTTFSHRWAVRAGALTKKNAPREIFFRIFGEVSRPLVRSATRPGMVPSAAGSPIRGLFRFSAPFLSFSFPLFRSFVIGQGFLGEASAFLAFLEKILFRKGFFVVVVAGAAFLAEEAGAVGVSVGEGFTAEGFPAGIALTVIFPGGFCWGFDAGFGGSGDSASGLEAGFFDLEDSSSSHS